jgi:hypothetical protein
MIGSGLRIERELDAFLRANADPQSAKLKLTTTARESLIKTSLV